MARNSMIALVAGGGFVPQSYIDSVQLTDSTIVPNAKKGYKGKSFIQFSFSSCFHRATRILAWAPLLHRSLRWEQFVDHKWIKNKFCLEIAMLSAMAGTIHP